MELDILNKNQYKAKFSEIFESLNDIQQKAVQSLDGPVLVLAGPGTGKTQVLSARIGNILNHPELQAEPHNILCLTFTDAGTIAMRQRLLEFIGPTAHRVNIYTFHAFCNEIIQTNPDYFLKRDFEPVSGLENIQILQKIIDEFPNDSPLKRFKGDVYADVNRLSNLFRAMKEENWAPGDIEKSIDQYLNDLPTRDEYIYKRDNAKQGIKAGDVKQHKIDEQQKRMEKLRMAALLFLKYQDRMERMRRYDYSDMILWILRAFKKDKEFLQQYQERYQFFLVDEYQDTNGAQNEILQLLIGYWDKPDVFVVGDDDQSIYRFQGANVKNIMDFYQTYKEHISLFVLTDNYRSSQNILDTTKILIDKNQDRLINLLPKLDKTLLAKNTDYADSPAQPKVVELPNMISEEIHIIRSIEALLDKEDLTEIAVIYTQHKHSDNLVKLLEKKNIPYNISKKYNILELPLIKKFVRILEYIQAESESTFQGEHLLFEILHYDFLSIDYKDIFKLSIALREKAVEHIKWRSLIADQLTLSTLELQNLQAIQDFDKNVTQWIGDRPNLSLQVFLENIINQGGILAHILRSPDKIWLMEALTTFFNFAKEENVKIPSLTLKNFLTTLDLMKENNIPIAINKTIHNKLGINLLTAHAAKGLEFKHVFLIGCTKDNWEGNIGKRGYHNFSYPDTLTFSNEGSDIEEKRRLFYVALTRGKETLTLSYAVNNHLGKQVEKSLFVDDILEDGTIKIEPKSFPEKLALEYHAGLLEAAPKMLVPELEKAYLDKLLSDYKLNTTHLNAYLACPVTFYYEYLLKIPRVKHMAMAFGSAVHRSLKLLFDAVRKDPGEQFPAKENLLQFYHAELNREKDAFAEKQFQDHLYYGKEVLSDYYTHYVKEWNKVFVVEYHITRVEAEGIPINGTLDKIEFNGNDVNVIDYKTGKVENGKRKLTPPGDKDTVGGDYWRQLVFYKILLDNDNRNKWNMVSGEIDFIEQDANNRFLKQQLHITPEDVNIVKEQIKDTYQKIMAHDFANGCGKPECRWCNMLI